jgi:type VI protein secretion system component Hcp
MPIFMQMGLPGESNRLKGPVDQPPHVDWFEVSSVQFGIGRHAVYPGAPPSGGRRERTETVFREIVITMPDNGPLFFKASIDGEPFKTVIIDFERDGQSYLVLKLKDVQVSSYSLGSGGGRPMASITLGALNTAAAERDVQAIFNLTIRINCDTRTHTAQSGLRNRLPPGAVWPTATRAAAASHC